MLGSYRWTLILALILSSNIGGMSAVYSQCEPTTDCNNNGVLDSCDLSLGTSDDCDQNGIPDECDISAGTQIDCNVNGIPDSCEPSSPAALVPVGGFASTAGVALRNQYAVIGSPTDSTNGADAGAAHVFRRVGTQWIPDGAPLVASDGAPGDRFGTSISMDGQLLAVGAPGEDLGATTDVGAAYVFRRTLDTWSQIAKIILPSPIAQEEFGSAVSLRGNRLIVGAPQTVSGGTGRAVIYSYDGVSWSIDAILSPQSLTTGDAFGRSVAIGVTHAFIGVPLRTTGGTPGAGEVYIYELSGSWSLASILSAATPETLAEFGSSISGNDNTVAIGAPGENSGTGVVHIFDKVTGTWISNLELNTPSATPSGGFGSSLDMGIIGDRLIVSELESVPLSLPGQAHIFTNQAGTWVFSSSLTGGNLGEEYGAGVATDGRYGLISAALTAEAEVHWVAPVEDCNGNGIDDFCDINLGSDSDCNTNSIPDSCDLANGTSTDCDGDLVLDECQLSTAPELDCNGNGLLDSCDFASGTSLDCNLNGIPDECDIASGLETDCAGDSIPDSCQGLVDTEDPEFVTAPDNFTVSTDPGFCFATVNWDVPTATDNCGFVTVTGSHLPGTIFPVGTETVTYTATDSSGNSATHTFTFTVADNTGPVIVNLPTDFSVPASTGFCSGVISWTPPTATDPCGLISLTSNLALGSTRPVGQTTITYTAVDVYGNTTSASFVVTVVDSRPPEMTGVPSDQSLEATAGGCGATATWSPPTLNDNCPNSTLVASHPPGSFFPVGSTEVTYTGSDNSGNSTSASFTINVVDTLPPTIANLPVDHTVSIPLGLCATNVVWIPPVITDNCGIASTSSTLNPGALLSPGIYPITYEATDVHGNSAAATFTVNVVDAEDPVLSNPPGDIVINLAQDSCSTIVTWTPPIASDNCGLASLVSTAAPGQLFPAGVHTVTYTATDDSGNTATVSFIVTVVDPLPPTIPDLPAGVVTTTDPNSCQATVFWNPPTGVDNCAISMISSTHQPGDLFPIGDTLVTYTVSDSGGNTASGSFTVTVVDIEPPTISGLPPTLTASTDPGSCEASVMWPFPVIDDNCAVVSSSGSHSPGDSLPIGTTLVSYSASDAAGNQTNAIMEITVADSEPPNIGPIPADFVFTLPFDDCTTTHSWFPPTASDNCGISDFVSSHQLGDTFQAGETQVTFTATDVNGNITEESFLVTVIDAQPPLLEVLPSITVPAPPGSCSALVDIPLPLVSDNCGVASASNDLNGTINASGEFPLGSTTITWTAIDVNGNITTTVQVISVVPPVGSDCNNNGISDFCDLIKGNSADCNQNGVPDECDLANGTSQDLDSNGQPDECEERFNRGDINADSNTDISDGVSLLLTLFSGAPPPSCLDAADVNDDGLLDISDVIRLINYIFGGSAAPPPPFGGCGIDDTMDDALDCQSFPPCP